MKTINYAILGLLSWRAMSGYDIKKLFSDSAAMYWSGNNNQIYTTLVKLHKDGLVSREVRQQESLPAKKIYTITPAGKDALRNWVLSEPEYPQLRNSFLIQLAWADQLSQAELDQLLNQYQEELEAQKLIIKTQSERKVLAPERSEREIVLWEMISENWVSFYENELAWLEKLRKRLSACWVFIDSN